jgi:hypothetical protein
MKRYLLITGIALFACSLALAQDSLGDAARQARAEKSAQPKAKIVVDDEVAPLKTRSAFPEIALKGLDNTGEICTAIEHYRGAHNKPELEAALHDWFDEYDNMIRLYLREQVLAQERQSDPYSRPQPTYNGDYRKYWEAIQARQRADEADRRRSSSDQATIRRVQQGLQRVQYYLQNHGLNFPWFKVRQSATDSEY